METPIIHSHNRQCPTTLVFLFVVLPAVAIIAGCGPNRPARVPVSGQVLLDGQPLGGGTIRLYPASARPASARIGPDGRFTLKTFETGDGAVLGAHPVSVAYFEEFNDTKRKWLAPKKYADPSTSGLTVTIDSATDSLTIELTWDGGKPFVERLVDGNWQ